MTLPTRSDLERMVARIEADTNAVLAEKDEETRWQLAREVNDKISRVIAAFDQVPALRTDADKQRLMTCCTQLLTEVFKIPTT